MFNQSTNFFRKKINSSELVMIDIKDYLIVLSLLNESIII